MPTDQLYDKCDPDSDAYSPEFAAAWDKAVPQVPSIFGHAALSYQRKGVEVIPLRPGRKEPVTKNGLNDSSDNPMQCVIWWGKDRGNPRYNVGMATGQPSGGIIVIDLDVHDDAANGIETLRDWEVNHGKLPETWQQETGSGGRQLFYRVSYEIRNSANAELGVDVRGDGGYVVMPPSIHPSGDAYEWLTSPDDMDVADANNKVYEFLDYVRRNNGTKASGDEKFTLPDKIRKGERDTTLFKYACHLQAIGRSDEEMLASVMGVNALRCDPPMDSRDIERIVKSACRYDKGENEDDTSNVGAPGKKRSRQFMTDRGKAITNAIGAAIINDNRARIIDGAPAVWTGKHWEFGTRAIKRLTLKYCDSAKAQDKNEVVSYVLDSAPHVESDREFNGRPYVQFSNATYDVISGDIVEPTPEMYIIATLPVELNEDEPENIADHFLESISAGDREIEQVMCEIIGACMCSQHIISQSPMLIGRAGGANGMAANGKSTYINAIRGVLGNNNVSSLDIATLGQRFQAGRVVGKLANLGDDIPDNFLKGEELSTFKKLVTGDTIYTDVKGTDGFEFKPTATMVFSMNQMPRLQDTTDGVFRRLAFVPFKRRFSPDNDDYDPKMGRKLAQPASLRRLALLGLTYLQLMVYDGELTHIPEMDEEIETIRETNDSVAFWINENSINSRNIVGLTVQSVYDSYYQWCRNAGERNPVSLKSFGRRVLQNIPDVYTEKGPTGNNGKRTRIYKNIN